MFYGVENGGIGEKIMWLACSDEKLQPCLLMRDLHVICDNNFAAEASLIGCNAAPEHARHIIFHLHPHFRPRRTRICDQNLS